jgi:hypothetical protein
MKNVLLVFLIVTWLLGWAVAVEYLVDKYGEAPAAQEKAAENHARAAYLDVSNLILTDRVAGRG